MLSQENKKFIYRTIKYTIIIVSLVIFMMLYDFNVVKDFIYSNF